MIAKSESNVLEILKIKFVNRHQKQYAFLCNGVRFNCYEQDDFAKLYIEYKNKEIEITEQDKFFVRFNVNWIKD